MKNKKYWYLYRIGECPVCGKDKSHRVRMYTKKPKDSNKRIIFINDIETYDWCDQ